MLQSYPLNEINKILEFRKYLTVYERKEISVAAFRPDPRRMQFEEMWRIDFNKGKEYVLAASGSRAKFGSRSPTVDIRGRILFRLEGPSNIFAILNGIYLSHIVQLYIVNVNHGKIYSIAPIYHTLTFTSVFFEIYDNAILSGFHHEDPLIPDSIVLVEVCTLQENPHTYNPKFSGIPREEQEPMGVRTHIDIGWKIHGMTMILTKNAEYIVTADTKGNIYLINTENIKRGGTVKAEDIGLRKLEAPPGISLSDSVKIEFSPEEKRFLLHGVDIYSIKV